MNKRLYGIFDDILEAAGGILGLAIASFAGAAVYVGIKEIWPKKQQESIGNPETVLQSVETSRMSSSMSGHNFANRIVSERLQSEREVERH